MATDATQKRWRLPTLGAVTLSGVLVGIALIAFSLEEGSIHIKVVDLPSGIQACSADTDCMLLKQIGCCSCKSGGARGAINGKRRQEWRRFVKQTCRYKGVCVRVKTCQYDLEPACVDGRCIARAAHG